MVTTERDLSVALLGKTRSAVLAIILSRPGQSFYLREIARMAGGALGGVQRELRHLVEAGVIQRKARGRLVYYSANQACPIVPELRGLMTKTAGAGGVLRTALAHLSSRIETAFIFGSVAAGRERGDSDVDVMVVGDVTFAEVVRALSAAQDQLGREVNPTVYPPAEVRSKLKSGHHFLRSVFAGDKMLLLGDAHELTRLAKSRLAG